MVLDASLPGGLVAGVGAIRYGQTTAFTTLMLGQLFNVFNVFNARADERSAFAEAFSSQWLWAAVGLSLMLHVAVLYIPFLQQAFSTRGLTASDWLRCAAVASAVLWVRELSKATARGINRRRATRRQI